jgi:IstB-like ATP binding protein
VLKALLAEEVAGRDRAVPAICRAAAVFRAGKTLGAWDQALSSIPPPTQVALRTLEWIGRRENLVVCGPAAGTGETFFLEAIGQQSKPGCTSPGSPSKRSACRSAIMGLVT